MMRAHESKSPLFPYTTLFRSQSTRASRFIIGGTLRPCRALWSFAARATRSTAERSSRTFLSTLNPAKRSFRSEEHTSELQSHSDIVCRLLLDKKHATSCYLRK